MTIRPEIQELLDRTALSRLPDSNVSKPEPFKTAAVGELQDPIEKFYSSYRTEQVRPVSDRTEQVRVEWFSESQIPAFLIDLADTVIIVHNHSADCPCYTNFGCRRVR